HVAVIRAQLFWTKLKFQVLLLARLQGDSPKSLQLFHRTRQACGHVANINLDHFVAGALANVLNISAYANSSCWLNFGWVQGNVRNPELCVTQAEAKWKLRRPWTIKIFRSVTVCRIRWAAGVHMVVVDRHLANSTRKGDWKFAAGIYIAKENIRDRITALC